MSVIATDDFSVNGNLAGRTTITGGKTWTVTGGTAATSSGQALWSDSASNEQFATIDAGVADLDAQVKFAAVDNNATYLVFRFTDTSNFWSVYNASSVWKLHLRLGGGIHDDPNTYSAAAANNDVVRVVANGSGTGAIQVYINGTLRITSSQNETFLNTPTKVGIGINFNIASRFDDFTVSDLNASTFYPPLPFVHAQAVRRAAYY